MRSEWFDKELIAIVTELSQIAIIDGCEFIENNVKNSMVEGNYREWHSKVDGSPHWSSQPGTPPAPDTEELKNSIHYVTSFGSVGNVLSGDAKLSNPVYGSNTGLIVGNIGTTNEKGLRHELGLTWYQVKRPFLRPQLDKNSFELLNIFKKYLGK